MKEFIINVDESRGENLSTDALYILKQAIFERTLDLHPPSKLTSPTLEANKRSLEFEEQCLQLDKRLQNGLELIVSKLR